MATIQEIDQDRAEAIDDRVKANADALNDRLRLMEKQQAAELKRFGPAPKSKPSGKG